MVAAPRVTKWSAPYSLSAAVLACSVCVCVRGTLLYSGGLALVRSGIDSISWSVVPTQRLNLPIVSSRITLTG